MTEKQRILNALKLISEDRYKYLCHAFNFKIPRKVKLVMPDDFNWKDYSNTLEHYMIIYDFDFYKNQITDDRIYFKSLRETILCLSLVID